MKAFVGNDFAAIGTRTVFNKTLRHLVNVSGLIETIDKGGNLADQLVTLEQSGVIIRQQIPPIMNVILGEKFNYSYKSINMDESITDFTKIKDAVKKWTGVDFVINYYHPNLGVIPMNPKNEAHWSNAPEFKNNELVVVFARTINKNPDTSKKAVNAFISLLRNETPDEDPSFLQAPPQPARPPAAVPPVAAPAQAPVSSAPAPIAAAPSAPSSAPAGGGAKNLTPKYSVQVSNELFHNGNVEAWKNIIESFQAKHTDCNVIVYHEGELIQDLNSLFKWGKVKHGGLIFFQIAGNNIKNVSRLQKYLYEGASKRYEAFMKKDVNKILNLF